MAADPGSIVVASRSTCPGHCENPLTAKPIISKNNSITFFPAN